MELKKSLLAGALLAAISIPAQAISISTDIISVVDESGSMGGEHAWIDDAILSLEAGLVAAAGADPLNSNYGLVGFGGIPAAAVGYDVGGAGQKLGTAAQFAASANANLNASGGFEDGYDAIDFVFDTYPLNAGYATNILLISDEDRDVTFGSPNNKASVLAQFTSGGALLNSVVNCNFVDGSGAAALGIDSAGNAYIADGMGGYTTSAGGVQAGGCFGSTNNDYVDLALQTGGAAWNLNFLRAGGLLADSFTAAFVDIKIGEIIIQQVPEPAGLAVMGLGLVGLAGLRRRQKAAR